MMPFKSPSPLPVVSLNDLGKFDRQLIFSNHFAPYFPTSYLFFKAYSLSFSASGSSTISLASCLLHFDRKMVTKME